VQTRFVNRPPDDWQEPSATPWSEPGPLPWEAAPAQPRAEERFPWGESTAQARSAFPWEQEEQGKKAAKKSEFSLRDPSSWRLEENWPTLAGVGAAAVLFSGLVLVVSSNSSTPATAATPTPVPAASPAVDNGPVAATPQPRRPRVRRGIETTTTAPDAAVASTATTVLPTSTVSSVPAPVPVNVAAPVTPPVATAAPIPAPVTILPGTAATPAAINTPASKDDGYKPYQGLTKEDLKDILKDVGRKDPFSTPAGATIAPPPIAPPPALRPIEPPKPLEPTPTIAALAYSPTVGWLGQVQLGEQTYDAAVGGRVGTWTVRSVGSMGVILVRGKEKLFLRY